MNSPESNAPPEIEGSAECCAIAVQWFLERGQFMFFELPLSDQLLFAKAAHLDDEGFLKACRFLSAYCETYRTAQQAAELAAAKVGGNG